MSRGWWGRARLVAGVVVLVVLVTRVGSGPFLDGLRKVDGWSLAVGAGIAVPTTVCCAWRWAVVARGLGVGIPLPAAVASYYRSQLLNAALPGGVLGDLHRGVRHGRDAGDTGRGLRAVWWERLAGQVVQILVAVVVLLVLPSPWQSSMPVVALAVGVAVLLVAVLFRSVPVGGSSRWAGALRAARSDVRDGLLARRSWPGVWLASVVALTGHLATFLVAARTAGTTASAGRVLPLALLVLLAMAIPANVAGWGPREGVAAWAFGAAGLGAGQGVTTAVVYGVMVFVGCLPGAGVLAMAWVRPGAWRAEVERGPSRG